MVIKAELPRQANMPTIRREPLRWYMQRKSRLTLLKTRLTSQHYPKRLVQPSQRKHYSLNRRRLMKIKHRRIWNRWDPTSKLNLWTAFRIMTKTKIMDSIQKNDKIMPRRYSRTKTLSTSNYVLKTSPLSCATMVKTNKLNEFIRNLTSSKTNF